MLLYKNSFTNFAEDKTVGRNIELDFLPDMRSSEDRVVQYLRNTPEELLMSISQCTFAGRFFPVGDIDTIAPGTIDTYKVTANLTLKQDFLQQFFASLMKLPDVVCWCATYCPNTITKFGLAFLSLFKPFSCIWKITNHAYGPHADLKTVQLEFEQLLEFDRLVQDVPTRYIPGLSRLKFFK